MGNEGTVESVAAADEEGDHIVRVRIGMEGEGLCEKGRIGHYSTS